MMPTRMSLKKNLMAACSIGVLAVVVTGCSSNDKGVSPELAAAQRQVSDANSALVAARLAAQDAAAEAAAEAAVALAAAEAERDEAQAAATAAGAERDEAQAAATAAGEALTGAIASVIAGFEAAGITLSPEAAAGDLDALGADLLAAATALSDANTALAAAMMQADADAMEIASLTQARDDAQTDLADAMTQAGMDATTISDMMAQIATLTTERDAALGELADLVEDEADVAAQKEIDDRIAREAEIGKAIETSAVVATDAAPMMPGTGSDVDGVVLKRDTDGTVTIDFNGRDDDEYDGGEVDAGSGDWTTAVLTRANSDDSTDTIVVYTDIEGPEDQLLTGAGRDDEALPGGPYAYTRAELDNALQVDGTKDFIGNAKSSDFPSGPGVTFTYTGLKDAKPLTAAGTFAGVPGVFLCTAASCTLATDGKGDLTTIGSTGAWRFTATAPITATIKDPDGDYTYFGWWLSKPKKNSDTHIVEVFAHSTGAGALTVTANEVEGTARYTGPAVGKYVTKTFTAGVQTDAGVGHFTATANLKAVFDGDTEDLGISGTVEDFVLDDTTATPWEVTLTRDADFTQVFGAETEISLTGDSDDSIGMAGAWQGSFYDAGEDEGDAPGTVVGTFDAVTDNAGVIGAFGAKR